MPVRELLGKGSNWSNFFVHHFYWSSQTSQEWVAEIDVANKKNIYIRLIFPETVLKKERVVVPRIFPKQYKLFCFRTED